jgi:hypothetical protein
MQEMLHTFEDMSAIERSAHKVTVSTSRAESSVPTGATTHFHSKTSCNKKYPYRKELIFIVFKLRLSWIPRVLWHADPLLDGDREIGHCTAAVARQRTTNNRLMVFSARSAKQLNSNRGTVFSVRSVPRRHKQDNWSNELVVGQSPAGKNVSTEADDIVRIRHQATTGEDTSDWEDVLRAVVKCRVYELAIAL